MDEKAREEYEAGRSAALALQRGTSLAAAGGVTAALTHRQRDILESSHGKGRHRELAAHLAHRTDMEAPAAIATLDAAELDAQREGRARGDK